MRWLIFWNVMLVLATSGHAIFESNSGMSEDLPIKNRNYYLLEDACLSHLRTQMNLEKFASLVYKQMAFYFGSVEVARKGFAKLFNEQSKEESEHFEKFMNYISLRGGDIGTFNISMPNKSSWKNALDALKDAIELEHHVTREIIRLHAIAEDTCKDIHLVNFLESDFIDEQISSINKLMKLMAIVKSTGKDGYGEYLIDRDLFDGKISLDSL